MAARKKEETTHLSILDAVEALSNIADLDFEREVDVATEEEIAEQNHLVTARTVQWLEVEDPDSTITFIRETFHVVLDYLRDFYKHDYKYVSKPQAVEGVKTIMVLVGDAAQKLDKYTTLFSRTKAKNVKSLQEYKQLQEFYLTRVARKIEEGILGKWILALTKDAMARKETAARLKGKRLISTRYVFIDLESVKKDTEYELFFLKKEDGSRFFNPRLIRNIKLICDFGETITAHKEVDPILRINIWQDYAMHIAAKSIFKAQGVVLDRFFHEARKGWKGELATTLNKAVVALLMSCNPKNLLRNAPVKSCLEYFVDFQFFLRSALKSREYQRDMVYPPKRSAVLANCLLDVTHGLSRALFSSITGYPELVPVFERVFHKASEAQSPEHKKAAKESRMLWSRLAADNVAMKKLIKQHPNGPLIKDLEILEHGTCYAFDPIIQFNIPFQLYSLYLKERKISNIRMPSPTSQKFIHEAKILDEFKAFLHACTKRQFKRKHLIINLQDRTSWREHSRSRAIEELQSKRDFVKVLEVVTLPKDTEFYHQVSPYDRDNHAEVFIEHFKEHLADENCGFFFPQHIKKKLFPKFVDGVLDGIHKVFFSKRNVLSVQNRLDFIELFYLFLQLKLIEVTQSDSFSMLCKDGIDVGGVASTQFYAFLSLLSGGGVNESDVEHMNLILYTAPLLIRERVIIPEVFDRMITVLKRIEGTKDELGSGKFRKVINGAFGRFYKIPINKSLNAVPSM
ncbi:MAG: hypothetical protein K940chlam7_00314 [Chlamydiae bacterium]|nr:hypothetical protein [Chlamydiota bacterium]